MRIVARSVRTPTGGGGDSKAAGARLAEGPQAADRIDEDVLNEIVDLVGAPEQPRADPRYVRCETTEHGIEITRIDGSVRVLRRVRVQGTDESELRTR